MTSTPEQGALFDGLDATGQDVVAQAKARRAQTLAIAAALGPGPTYQGVSKTIRRLTATGTYADLPRQVDPVEHAGTIATLRQVARQIDHATGHNVTGWRANGRDLAPLLEQYRELMKSLTDGTDVDPFEDWLNDPAAPKESNRGDAPAPHPPL